MLPWPEMTTTAASDDAVDVTPTASYVRVADRGHVALSAGALGLRAVATRAEADATLDGAVLASNGTIDF